MPILSWLFVRPLAVGTEAPTFSLPDQNGTLVNLQDFRGKANVILVFYPGDDTGVCTKQLCELRDQWESLTQKDTAVLGVNPQRAEKHMRFRQKYGYPFPLLVDKGQHVAKLYRTSGLIVRRTVYLIGKSGTIRFGERGKPDPGDVLKTAE